ncbi:hypothetical protein SBRY_20807 [Actinacidiphila bryophytorum]|uniref:Uncharacterized protein n=1 Tax=Actinacidiphila bryophytorum TaxID=1436133 RepID=A0A9W4GZT5_9ACTN|nr:hypothetical protein SBRY_20807 [Actinacidiphila bryophytorum]
MLLVCLGRYDLHVEQHPGVVDTAELGALAHEDALLVGSHLEDVGVARDDVLLHQERHDPERVDDITRGEHEPDRLALRQPQRGAGVAGLRVLAGGGADVVDAFGSCRVQQLVRRDVRQFGRQLALRQRRRRGVSVHVLDVVEAPAPLEAHHVDDVLRLRGGLEELVLVARGEVEEHRDDHDRDDRVQRLDGQVVAGLRRDLDLGPAAAVEDHAPQDQAPDKRTGRQRRGPGALPQGEDARCLFGGRTGHAETGIVLVRAAGGHRQDQARSQRLREPPPQPAPRRGDAAHALGAVGEVGAVGTHVAPSRESRPRVRVFRPCAGRSARAAGIEVWMFMRTKPYWTLFGVARGGGPTLRGSPRRDGIPSPRRVLTQRPGLPRGFPGDGGVAC